MNVLFKKMSSVFIYLELFYLVTHNCASAFHVDKPMIYINFFDDVVTDNASSKFVDKGLSTTTVTSNNSTKEVKKREVPKEHLKLNNEDKTSIPFESMFEFDMPGKADSTEVSDNDWDVDAPTTTNRFPEMMDPEFLEPEITRMFFLRAIANLIEHIMEALFSVDDTPILNRTAEYDYDSAPSRNLRKRDLSNAGAVIKVSDTSQSIEHKTDLKTSHISSVSSSLSSKEVTTKISDLTTEKENTEKNASSSHEPGKISEQSSHTPTTTLVTDHTTTTHHGDHKATDKLHKREDAASFVKSDLSLPDEKHHGKLIAHTNRPIPFKPEFLDEEEIKMFHFSDERSALNDEVMNKKDTRFFEGVHPAEDHDRLLDFADKEDNSKSGFIVTVFLISTTALVLMILGALALAAGYVVLRKGQESDNQNAVNVQTAVA